MKAILVIDDMPTSCFKCKFRDFGKCWASNSYVDVDIEKIPKECPLKPMPEKKEPFGYLDMGNEDGLYEKGWNTCIEELEK